MSQVIGCQGATIQAILLQITFDKGVGLAPDQFKFKIGDEEHEWPLPNLESLIAKGLVSYPKEQREDIASERRCELEKFLRTEFLPAVVATANATIEKIAPENPLVYRQRAGYFTEYLPKEDHYLQTKFFPSVPSPDEV